MHYHPVGFPNDIWDADTWSTNLFQPSVTIDKTAAEAYSKAGDVVHYTITVDNTSSNDSPDLVCTVTDPLLGHQPAGDPGLERGELCDQRHLHGPPGDPDPLVNTATVTCSPTGFPNILPSVMAHRSTWCIPP